METEFTAGTFEQALAACREKLQAQARRLTGSLQDAEDLVQEALTKAYVAWPNFRGEASFSTWVHRIMDNAYKDHLKKDSRMRMVSLDSDIAELRQVERSMSVGEDLARGLEVQDLRQSLMRALSELPKQYQRLLVLKYIRHFSYEELAQSFECSIESVRCRLYRARQEMRRLLGDNI